MKGAWGWRVHQDKGRQLGYIRQRWANLAEAACVVGASFLIIASTSPLAPTAAFPPPSRLPTYWDVMIWVHTLDVMLRGRVMRWDRNC